MSDFNYLSPQIIEIANCGCKITHNKQADRAWTTPRMTKSNGFFFEVSTSEFVNIHGKTILSRLFPLPLRCLQKMLTHWFHETDNSQQLHSDPLQRLPTPSCVTEIYNHNTRRITNFAYVDRATSILIHMNGTFEVVLKVKHFLGVSFVLSLAPMKARALCSCVVGQPLVSDLCDGANVCSCCLNPYQWAELSEILAVNCRVLQL